MWDVASLHLALIDQSKTGSHSLNQAPVGTISKLDT